jgi:hypothetical protein
MRCSCIVILIGASALLCRLQRFLLGLRKLNRALQILNLANGRICMIRIEEIHKKDVNVFWTLHWDYLNRDIFGPDDTDEDRAHFYSRDYRDRIELFMDRTLDKAHLVYFVREGTRIGARSILHTKVKTENVLY